MNDDEIVTRVLKSGLVVAPAQLDRIKALEQKMDITLPKLFKDILLKSNGGEFSFARMRKDYVPDDVLALNSDQIWDYFLDPIAHQLGSDGKSEARNKLLPIGDDYSGEVIAFDLSSINQYQVVSLDSLCDHPVSSFKLEGDFRSFVISSLESEEAADL